MSQKARYASSVECLLSSSSRKFKSPFRRSQHEFLRLVQRFGHDINSQAQSKRKQTIAKDQLALFIYRLARGHEVRAVSRLFRRLRFVFLPLCALLILEVAGTVERWTDNCIQAIIRRLSSHVCWPMVNERYDLKRPIKSRHALPNCVGFIDGSHVNLEHTPTRPTKTAGSFHSRKERYGFNIVAGVEDMKRICYLRWGFSASASDKRVQRSMRLHTDPDNYFTS